MSESPRSLIIAMSVGGILLLFILGAILSVSITEAMMTSVDRDVQAVPVAVAPAAEAGAGEAATPESAPATDAAAGEAAAPAAGEAAAEADTTTAPADTGAATDAAPAAGEAAAEEASAGVPPGVTPMDNVPVTDELQAAFLSGTCIACHVIPGIPSAVGQIGPDLTHIGTTAATRVPGESALEYIHQSIVDPTAFTAPDCPTGPCITGTMPPGLDTLVSPEDLNLMINYLAGLE